MQKLRKNKKGIAALNLLITGGVLLLIAILIVSFGTSIVQSISSGLDTTLYGSTIAASANATDGLSNIAGQSGLLGTVIALVVVILIILGLLYRSVQQQV